MPAKQIISQVIRSIREDNFIFLSSALLNLPLYIITQPLVKRNWLDTSRSVQ
jgi:hypothetical protein